MRGSRYAYTLFEIWSPQICKHKDFPLFSLHRFGEYLWTFNLDISYIPAFSSNCRHLQRTVFYDLCLTVSLSFTGGKQSEIDLTRKSRWNLHTYTAIN